MNYPTGKVIKGPTEIEFSAMLNMSTAVGNYLIAIGKFNWEIKYCTLFRS